MQIRKFSRFTFRRPNKILQEACQQNPKEDTVEGQVENAVQYHKQNRVRGRRSTRKRKYSVNGQTKDAGEEPTEGTADGRHNSQQKHNQRTQQKNQIKTEDTEEE